MYLYYLPKNNPTLNQNQAWQPIKKIHEYTKIKLYALKKIHEFIEIQKGPTKFFA